MKRFSLFVLSAITLGMLAGCASSEPTLADELSHEELATIESAPAAPAANSVQSEPIDESSPAPKARKSSKVKKAPKASKKASKKQASRRGKRRSSLARSWHE